MSTRWRAATAALCGALILAVVCVWWSRRASELVLPGVVEIQEVRLGSKVGGRVSRVAVLEGQIVEAGALLVEFEAPELTAQREQQQARVQEATADLEKARNGPREEEKAAAQSALLSAKARLKRAKAGFRTEEVQQAREDLKTTEADLNWTREEYDRTERIFRGNAGSRTDLDTARANRDRARGRYDSARFRMKMLENGGWDLDVEDASAEVARQQANYDLLYNGTRAEDLDLAVAREREARGRLVEIEANLREAQVLAPERVLIEVVGVRKGDLVTPNAPILRVLRADDLWVKAYVPETELGKVRLNSEVAVTVDAYPGKRFQGVVSFISSASEFTPRNVQSADERRFQVFAVKVRVADPEGVFKSGMAAEVRLPLANPPPAP
jgi:HlyD family secretion protein